MTSGVIPAKAGIQYYRVFLDSRLRGNDMFTQDSGLNIETNTSREFKITPFIKREIIKIADKRIKETHLKALNELKNLVKTLAKAQKRPEEEIRKLDIGINNLRGDVGGLARSFGYEFDNGAFRSFHTELARSAKFQH